MPTRQDRVSTAKQPSVKAALRPAARHTRAHFTAGLPSSGENDGVSPPSDSPAPSPAPAPARPEALAQAIAALEAQRAILGDAAVDAALAPLRAALGGTQTLRQVSVLFLDVVGSTSLSQHLDPEDMSSVMDELLAACTAIVKAHGGRVLQYAGDSLLAVFGADGAREDDAERAVHSALALVDEGAARAVLTLETHGHAGLHVRVGVHTGPVLLGGGVSEEASIRGHTVHVAARMEQSAPRGRVRISQDTWQQVRGVFDVQAQPPLHIKGQDAPMLTWLVASAKPRAFRLPARGIEGNETALVGRDDEVAALMAAFDAVCATRGLHSVTLLADAGLGKSRLIHELQHQLDAHPQAFWLLLGRALPSTRLQPYGLLRNVLAWRLQIADSDPAALARSRLVDGLLPLLQGGGGGGGAPADEAADAALVQAETLGQLLGMDFSASPRLAGLLNDSRALRDQGLAALARVLGRLGHADGSPVVMLLEDLHWADDASLDALWWLRKQPDLPMLQVFSARSELAERRPAWEQPATEDTHHRVLRLHALGGAQRQQLTRALLSRLAEPSPALEAMLERQAEGNPFYAEELIKMLIDDGVIVVDAEQATWQLLPAKLGAARIPLTLTGVLQARLDAMAAPEKRALQRASIVGPVFWDDALGRIDPSAPQALAAMQGRGMLTARSESAFAGTREFGFQHHLLHQVTYDTVLKSDKRNGHAAAAAWLAERVGDREAEYLAVTAEHYERAGDQVRALEWFDRAVKAAGDRFANQAALDFVARMLSICDPADVVTRYRLLQQQRDYCDLTGQRELQRRASDALLALAESQGRTDWLASVACNRALLHDRLGESEASREWAQRASELADASGEGSAGVLAEGQLAWLARESGDLAAAQEHLDRAFAWCPRAEAQWQGPKTFIYDIQLLLVAAQQKLSEDDGEAGLALAEEALALATERGVERLTCFAHDAAAIACIQLLLLERAQRHVQHQEEASLRIGLAMVYGTSCALRGRVELARGDFEAALASARAGAERLAAQAAQGRVAEAQLVAGQALLLLGRPQDAAEPLRQALAYHLRSEGTPDRHCSRTLLALALVRSGKPEDARALIEQDLPALREPTVFDTATTPQAGRYAAWQVLLLLGDARAAEHLALGQAELERRFAKIADPAARHRLLAAWRDESSLRMSPHAV